MFTSTATETARFLRTFFLGLTVLVLPIACPFAVALDIEDSFTRPDSTDLGLTEVGGVGYLEAGTTNYSADSADIFGGQLRLNGDGGIGKSNPGVAMVNIDLADLIISADVTFTYPNGVANTSTYNNGGFILRRNGTTPGFTGDNEGQIEISMQAGGGLFVREIFGGALKNLFYENPFGLGGTADNAYSAPGQLPTTVGGLPFDVNGNGRLDEDEPFRFGANLSGDTLSVLVNGFQIAEVTTSASEPSRARTLAGLYKNRWTSGGTRDVMTPLFDNLLIDGVVPLPPPPIVHLGDNDPVGEGWVLSTNGAVANNGPVDDGGIPAWNLEDTGSTRAAWTRWISYDQIAEANSKGWKLQGRVRVLGTDDVPDGGIELSVFPDSKVGYTLWLGSDAAGNAIVAEYGGVQASGLALGRSITLDSGGYHDYELVFDPASQTTDILVDGNLAIEDMLATQLTSTVLNRILWGANSSAGQGNANYSFVEFQIIPEPTSIVLGLAVVVLATLVVRRMSVSSL